MDKNIKKEKITSEQRHPEQDLVSLAEEAFIYGYPLVYNFDMIMRGRQGILSALSAPINTFHHERKLANYKDEFVSVNNDTIYSAMIADLSLEPLIIHIPDTGKRYNVFQFIDAWTNNFAYLGTRVSENKEGLYLLTGPDWNDELPQEVKQIKAPTNLVVVAARFNVNGEEDLKEVIKLQEQIWTTPLSFFPNVADVSKLKVEDHNLPKHDDLVSREIAFWEVFRVLLNHYPPSTEDKAYHMRFKPLGILNGKVELFSTYRNIDDELKYALQEGAKRGKAKIDEYVKNGMPINGWLMDPHAFDYNLDYFEIGTIDSEEWKMDNRLQSFGKRAASARAGLWGNHGYEAVYAQCFVDENNIQLNGSNKYKIHFDKVPPANAFWSLTMYNLPHFYLCKNPLDRYSIGDRTEGLKYNEDGSLDIYIQHDNPGIDKKSNWLPAPEGDFRPLLRIYLPKEDVTDGKYKLPPIQKL